MTQRAEQLVDRIVALDPLADLPRTGWLLRGVVPCESIAAHSLGVALVTMGLIDMVRSDGLSVDGEKTLRMALIHDASEARTGDIPMPVKTPAFDTALSEIEATLATRLLAPHDAVLWNELEAAQSLEARIVRAADKIHMLVKAWIYQSRRGASLEEFWNGVVHTRGLAAVREVYEVLYTRAGRSVTSWKTEG